MNGHIAGGASATPTEPLLHSQVSESLPPEHPLAHVRVFCDRCERLLHMQTNSCMRTWIESGRGNYCVRCFIVVAGGLAGVDCLSREFGLDARASV